ncbi:hypothetical protein PG993_000737 [Apiospora rasikravindrae]|uniref:Uncharacterized protein n=1 Tax=Apiospora rasikravindrae TaxID=990691 RepID=A0ABR1U9E3_9PEZI
MSGSVVNKYWIPRHDIHKKVITQELQYYLGPDATVRTYTREGEDGFLITTAGNCLTDEQIDDICIKSREIWEKQAAAKLDPEKPLKRPLHQPVLISQTPAEGVSKWRNGDRKTHDTQKPYTDRRRGEGSRR